MHQDINSLLERYFNAETTLEEEQTLRDFFSGDDVPAELQQWRALFVNDECETLGDDFDARIMEAIGRQSTENDAQPVVKARVVSLTQRLMPLFKAAAVVAILLTVGGALQTPFDNAWNTPDDYARYQQELDSVAVVSPVQAENINDVLKVDSATVLPPAQLKLR